MAIFSDLSSFVTKFEPEFQLAPCKFLVLKEEKNHEFTTTSNEYNFILI